MTSFWKSDYAAAGFFFLSWSAGSARLFVPVSHEGSVEDMKAARYVILTLGPLQGREGIELLFEDHSSRPYAIQMGVEQCDHILTGRELGANFVVSVWTRSGLKAELAGKLRFASELPCLQPWFSS